MIRVLSRAAPLLLVAGFAYGIGNLPHADDAAKITEEKPFGRQGDPRNATRTINLEVRDTTHFTPAEISVKAGETVRFEIRNSGKTTHELVLGRMEEMKPHAEIISKGSGSQHAEPYITQVSPGATNRMIWQFTRSGEFYYGCLLPDHIDGKFGKIVVR